MSDTPSLQVQRDHLITSIETVRGCGAFSTDEIDILETELVKVCALIEHARRLESMRNSVIELLGIDAKSLTIKKKVLKDLHDTKMLGPDPLRTLLQSYVRSAGSIQSLVSSVKKSDDYAYLKQIEEYLLQTH
jgi:hypothetical protein